MVLRELNQPPVGEGNFAGSRRTTKVPTWAPIIRRKGEPPQSVEVSARDMARGDDQWASLQVQRERANPTQEDGIFAE